MTEKEIFEHYKRVAKMTAAMFAPYAEALVHDLREPHYPIMEIYNGHISGRKVGDHSKIFLHLDEHEHPPEQLINYMHTLPNGNKKTVRGSSMTFKNEQGELIGAYTINFDSSHLDKAVEMISQFTHYTPSEKASQEDQDNFLASRSDIRNEVLKVIMHMPVNSSALTKKDKQEIVKQLLEQGHFNKRGIVSVLSEELGLTRATIYRYVRLARGEEDSKSNKKPVDIAD